MQGINVIEIASIGPGPFCAMVLADLGADVIRVERTTPGTAWPIPPGPLERGRRSIRIDLKDPAGVDLILRMVEAADALVEGFRPGVAERLGIGPDECLARNQGLIYGRATGWGRDGPLAGAAGHDLNYLAPTGVLHAIGPEGRPSVPLNLTADFGGGGMLLAVGILSGLLHRDRSGAGQVVDAAMVDGVALLTAQLRGLMAAGLWEDRRNANLLDGGAPFYDVYETSDGGFVAVAALEQPFYDLLVARLGFETTDLPDRLDRGNWPQLRRVFSDAFAAATRDEWADRFAGEDACVTPVLALGEALDHPHLAARGTLVEVDGMVHPAPAPRFSRTPPEPPGSPQPPGADTDAVLAGLGLDAGEIARLREAGTVA